MNLSVNWGLLMTMMCHYRLIDLNKFTAAVKDVNSKRGCAWGWGAGLRAQELDPKLLPNLL